MQVDFSKINTDSQKSIIFAVRKTFMAWITKKG